MKPKMSLACVAAAALALSACGETTTDRAEGGAAVGAGTGAAIGALAFGIGAIPGALIGAAVGGGTGAATRPDQVNLGEPVWDRNRADNMAQGNAPRGAATASAAPMQPAPAATAPSSRVAMAGDDVRAAQETLKEHGLYRGQLDGLAGPETRAAVAAYQRRNGLPASGTLDGATMARLENDHTTGYGASGAPARPTAVGR